MLGWHSTVLLDLEMALACLSSRCLCTSSISCDIAHAYVHVPPDASQGNNEPLAQCVPLT